MVDLVGWLAGQLAKPACLLAGRFCWLRWLRWAAGCLHWLVGWAGPRRNSCTYTQVPDMLDLFLQEDAHRGIISYEPCRMSKRLNFTCLACDKQFDAESRNKALPYLKQKHVHVGGGHSFLFCFVCQGWFQWIATASKVVASKNI